MKRNNAHQYKTTAYKTLCLIYTLHSLHTHTHALIKSTVCVWEPESNKKQTYESQFILLQISCCARCSYSTQVRPFFAVSAFIARSFLYVSSFHTFVSFYGISDSFCCTFSSVCCLSQIVLNIFLFFIIVCN